jgi:DNA-binding GntR family transcriptional regulator
VDAAAVGGPRGVTADAALVDALVADLRERIVGGLLAPGAPLRTTVLAAEYGVSRTPVRHALRELHALGLVRLAPRRPATVCGVAPWDVRAAYEVLAELEGLAAERAARVSTSADIALLRRQSAQAHARIRELAGNPWLTRAIDQLEAAFPNGPAVAELDASREHDTIIAALDAGDGGAARVAMARHVRDIGARLEQGHEERARVVFSPAR